MANQNNFNFLKLSRIVLSRKVSANVGNRQIEFGLLFFIFCNKQKYLIKTELSKFE